jgi:hypothetical protein
MGKKRGKEIFRPWIKPFFTTKAISTENTIISIMLKAHTYTLPKAKGVKRIKKMSPNSMIFSEGNLNCFSLVVVDHV